MRLKLLLRNPNGRIVTFNYQYRLAAFLKASIMSLPFDQKILGTNGYRFYTFSNLLTAEHTISKRGIMFQEAEWYISSPNVDFIEDLRTMFQYDSEIWVGNTGLEISSIELLPNGGIGTQRQLRTLSPLYVKGRSSTGKEKDLYPTVPGFYENLKENLVSRYQEYHNQLPDDIYFEIVKILDFKPKRIRMGGSYRRASMLKFIARGSSELMDFAYNAGLGQKEAQGFGCIGLYENNGTN